MKRLLLIFFCALLLPSCVSVKSYRQAKSRMLSLEIEKQQMAAKITILELRNSTLESEWVRLNKEYQILKDEVTKLEQNEELQKGTTQTKR